MRHLRRGKGKSDPAKHLRNERGVTPSEAAADYEAANARREMGRAREGDEVKLLGY